ncbi:MAG: hypothetical protein H6550_15920 [Chitinophagales bacterium]|nr:hypothetical protein [Chitinophagales bacterium]
MQKLVNKGLNTTYGKIYLMEAGVAPEQAGVLEAQFVPQTLSDPRTADIAALKVIGRNNPRYQHTGGEDSLTLNLDFVADEGSHRSVLAKINWLKAFTYNDGGNRPARRLILAWGNMYDKHRWIVKSVTPTKELFNHEFGMLPDRATVEVQLLLDTDFNWGWDDVAPYTELGEQDGNDPLRLGPAYEGPAEDQAWRNITNDNNFESILRRLVQRLRL